MENKADILSMTPEELSEFVVGLGEKSFRAKQLFSWMHKGAQIEEMSNLPAAFRAKLAESADSVSQNMILPWQIKSMTELLLSMKRRKIIPFIHIL